jgi:hypothetical protein
MSDNTTIHDPAFDRTVTLRDAYRIMERFVEAYHNRGETETGTFIGYFCIAPDGIGSDPAALYDYLEAVEEVLGPPVV